MRKIYSFFLSISFAVSGFGQYCTAVGPSSGADSNVESVVLNGIGSSINYIGCPGVIGLQNLTSQGTTLSAGSSYSISVQFGTCGGNYAGAGTVWIDYDQNGSFDAYEVLGTWAGTPPVALSVFNFVVPTGAINGATRMRVMQQEATTLPLNPCATFSWGSVMDFSITIQNGVDCSGYPGDDKLDAIPITSFPFTDTRDNSYCYTNNNYVYNSPDIFYAIVPNATLAQVTASLCGSSFDTFLSAIDTAGNVLAYNDDYTSCGSSSQITLNTLNVGPFYIIVEGWGSEMGSFTLNVTSSTLGNDELIKKEISIYPNPSSDYIQIEGYSGDIVITDVFGKIVEKLNYTENNPIDLTRLSYGCYTVQLTNTPNQISKKLFLKK